MKSIFRRKHGTEEKTEKSEREYRAMLRERELEQKNITWLFVQMRDFRL